MSNPIKYLTPLILLVSFVWITQIGCQPGQSSSIPEITSANDSQSKEPPTESHETILIEPDVKQPAVKQPDNFNSDNAGGNNNDKEKKDEKEYTEAQLNKHNTLYKLTYQPDIRANMMISNVRKFIDDEQARRATAIVRSYDDVYQGLLDKRAAILETATDETDVQNQLIGIRKTTADLHGIIRREISDEILTPDQRANVKKHHEDLAKAEKEIQQANNPPAAELNENPPQNN